MVAVTRKNNKQNGGSAPPKPARPEVIEKPQNTPSGKMRTLRTFGRGVKAVVKAPFTGTVNTLAASTAAAYGITHGIGKGILGGIKTAVRSPFTLIKGIRARSANSKLKNTLQIGSTSAEVANKLSTFEAKKNKLDADLLKQTQALESQIGKQQGWFSKKRGQPPPDISTKLAELQKAHEKQSQTLLGQIETYHKGQKLGFQLEPDAKGDMRRKNTNLSKTAYESSNTVGNKVAKALEKSKTNSQTSFDLAKQQYMEKRQHTIDAQKKPGSTFDKAKTDFELKKSSYSSALDARDKAEAAINEFKELKGTTFASDLGFNALLKAKIEGQAAVDKATTDYKSASNKLQTEESRIEKMIPVDISKIEAESIARREAFNQNLKNIKADFNFSAIGNRMGSIATLGERGRFRSKKNTPSPNTSQTTKSIPTVFGSDFQRTRKISNRLFGETDGKNKEKIKDIDTLNEDITSARSAITEISEKPITEEYTSKNQKAEIAEKQAELQQLILDKGRRQSLLVQAQSITEELTNKNNYFNSVRKLGKNPKYTEIIKELGVDTADASKRIDMRGILSKKYDELLNTYNTDKSKKISLQALKDLQSIKKLISYNESLLLKLNIEYELGIAGNPSKTSLYS
jgi:hypothetical protein